VKSRSAAMKSDQGMILTPRKNVIPDEDREYGFKPLLTKDRKGKKIKNVSLAFNLITRRGNLQRTVGRYSYPNTQREQTETETKNKDKHEK